MARTAEVIYVGDAASLIKASEAAAAATKASADEIAASNAKIAGSSDAAGVAVGRAATHHEEAASRVKKAWGALQGSIGFQVGVQGMVVAGAAAVKMSVDFNKSMTLIHTQAGATEQEVSKMGKAVLAMGEHSQQGPQKLAEGLYMIESVGLRGATALATLDAAQKGASLGQANMEETASALTSAMVAYHLAAGQAAVTMGELDAIVGVGKMHMEELVQALGSGILPTAQAVGLSLRSIGAALATMTDAGVPAEQAATKMRTILLMLAHEHTKAAVEGLASVGLTADELATTMRKPDGLVKMLELLHSHMEGLSKVQRVDLMTSLAGGSRSAGTLIILEENLARVKQRYEEIGKLGPQFMSRVKAEEATPGAKLAEAWSTMRVELIKFGTVLTPVVVAAAQGLALILKEVTAFAPKIKTALQGPVFDWLKATTLQVLNDVGSIFKGAFTFIEGVGRTFAGVFTLNFSQMWSGIKQAFSGGVHSLLAILDAMTAPFQGAASAAFGAIESAARSVWHEVTGTVSGLFHDAVGIVTGFFNELYNAGKYVIGGLVKGIESGASAVVDAAKKVANLPGEAVHAVLGIKSPSKVFEQIGAYIAEGFAGGLLSGAEMVKAGLTEALLFPIDAAIEALKDKVKTIEQATAAAAKAAERSKLVEAIQSAGTKAATTLATASIALGASSPALASAHAPAHLGGGSVEQQIVNFFTPLLSRVAGAGIAGNALQESGFDPNAPGGGLFQTIGGRGVPQGSSVMAQLQSAWREIQSRGEVGALRGARTPQAAAEAFEKSFERAGIPEMAHRIAGAQQAYSRSGGAVQASTAAVTDAAEAAHLEARLAQLHHEKLNLPTAASGKAGAGTRAADATERKRIANEELAIHEKLHRLKAEGKAESTVTKDTAAYGKAVSALAEFDRKAAEAQKLAKINIQIEHLEAVKRWSEMIDSLKVKMKELAGQAGAAWAAIETKAIELKHTLALGSIETGPNSAALKAKKAEDEAEATRHTEESNKEALEAAKQRVKEARGNENPEELKKALAEQKRAEEAITAFARSQDEKRTEQKIEAETKAADSSQQTELSALEGRTKAYEGMLESQLNALVGQLAKSEIAYSVFAANVNKILKGTGVSFTPTPGEQGTVNPSNPEGWPANPAEWPQWEREHGLHHGEHRASGGGVIPGVGYMVGETGPERFTPGVAGTITPASRSSATGGATGASGAGLNIHGDLVVNNRQDADRFAHQLAHRLTYGGRG